MRTLFVEVQILLCIQEYWGFFLFYLFRDRKIILDLGILYVGCVGFLNYYLGKIFGRESTGFTITCFQIFFIATVRLLFPYPLVFTVSCLELINYCEECCVPVS